MIKVPSFLTKVDKAEKEELMKEYMQWKESDCTLYLASKLESELDKLVTEDEKNSFSSYFQTRWNRAMNLGKRSIYRQLLKDL